MKRRIGDVLASSILVLLCQGRLCTLIIDGGSCSNLASEELVEKLNIKTEDHSNPYQRAWVNDTSILVSSRCLGI